MRLLLAASAAKRRRMEAEATTEATAAQLPSPTQLMNNHEQGAQYSQTRPPQPKRGKTPQTNRNGIILKCIIFTSNTVHKTTRRYSPTVPLFVDIPQAVPLPVAPPHSPKRMPKHEEPKTSNGEYGGIVGRGERPQTETRSMSFYE